MQRTDRQIGQDIHNTGGDNAKGKIRQDEGKTRENQATRLRLGPRQDKTKTKTKTKTRTRTSVFTCVGLRPLDPTEGLLSPPSPPSTLHKARRTQLRRNQGGP